MSDFNSSLPIRTESAGDVEIKIVDGIITTQKMTVNPDGSINSVVTATDLDIRDLVFATDKVDVSGSTVALDAPTLAALESITVQNGAGASAVNIQDGGNSITVDSVDLDIRDLVFATDKVDVSGSVVDVNVRDATGAPFSATNPLPVTMLVDNIGTEVNDYKRAITIAKDFSDDHDYTVTAGKTLLLKQIEASASGKARIEVKIETGVATGIFTSKFVQFNSTATPNMTIDLKSPISVAAGVRVRVTVTNLDQPQDLYSTISGQEI